MTRNLLAKEKSPYLLQHADNPVDWYPWGTTAFETAKKEDKPVFLSIGYATCHWCHVMAHESFESPGVAKLMNDAFVNIKVDREERPDIDNTYMTVCQMMTGSGGWPLTIIMTPEKKPFYAATYIPKRGRHGRPGMMELIPWIRELWQEKRDEIYNSAEEIVDVFQKSTAPRPAGTLSDTLLDEAFDQFGRTFDSRRGGFGESPKFPSPHNLMFLLRYWGKTGNEHALAMVKKTLREMRLGGIYDHIGFGFHRYSTDRGWLLPHFEKMLYDQALLLMAYTEGWQATGNSLYRRTVHEIASYLFRNLTDQHGGFYCAEDADSDGEEGKFYVWTINELRRTLSEEEASLFMKLYNFEAEGNFHDESTLKKTGKNIPYLNDPLDDLAKKIGMDPEELEQRIEIIRKKLLNERENRTRPLLDDKILTDWNGLTIAALAKAGKVLNNEAFVDRAEKATEFVFSEMRSTDGSLLHRYREGEAAIEGHADDYAFLIWGLLELYEATLKTVYLARAKELNDIFMERFWDEEHGAFFFTQHNSETVLGRTKEGYDGAVPSGNSVAMMNLQRLGRLLANPELEERSEQIARFFGEQIERAPTGFGQMLQAVLFGRSTTSEVVIAGKRSSEDTQRMFLELNRRFIPGKVVVLNDPDDPNIVKLAPYTQNQLMIENRATAYVCKNYSCEQPVTDPAAMLELLKS